MPTPKLGKGLGRKPDKPDDRDLVVLGAGLRGPSDPWMKPVGRTMFDREIGAPLPSSADVFMGLSLPVYDQGSLGSCTANAGVLYRRFLAQRFAQYSAPDEDLSRLFLYYQERKLPWNNDVASDGGAAIRDIFYVLAHTGVCPEQDDPYAITDFASPNSNNSPHSLADAESYKVGAYHRVPDVDTARSVLASGYAVALGFTVYESFESIDSHGVMPMPKPGEQVIGGHAVVIYGYDDHDQVFIIRNSWGESWGSNGDFYMPYAFIENTALSNPDMWIGHLGKPWRAA